MSRDFYEDDCAGCKPAIIDQKTGQVMSDTDPIMVRVNAAFEKASRPQKMAWHNITCHNSRDPEDMTAVQPLLDSIQKAIKE